jgi:hypothetical protein
LPANAKPARCSAALNIGGQRGTLPYRKTKEEGTTIWEELHETVYGERQYGVADLDGHRWLFSQPPETWTQRIGEQNPRNQALNSALSRHDSTASQPCYNEQMSYQFSG